MNSKYSINGIFSGIAKDTMTDMRLPNPDNAIIPDEKFGSYLLSKEHPIGRFKATFFRKLGYTIEDSGKLKTDIQNLLRNEATKREKTEYGQKFEVRGTITGPSKKSAEIVTAWIILDGEDIPRFITAYPEYP